MSKLISQFLISLISSSLVMKYNLKWHRKIILMFTPLFLLFTIFQTEYIIMRVKEKAANEKLC